MTGSVLLRTQALVLLQQQLARRIFVGSGQIRLADVQPRPDGSGMYAQRVVTGALENMHSIAAHTTATGTSSAANSRMYQEIRNALVNAMQPHTDSAMAASQASAASLFSMSGGLSLTDVLTILTGLNATTDLHSKGAARIAAQKIARLLALMRAESIGARGAVPYQPVAPSADQRLLFGTVHGQGSIIDNSL